MCAQQQRGADGQGSRAGEPAVDGSDRPLSQDIPRQGETGQAPLASLDVFETSLIRILGDPSSVAFLVSRRLRAAGIAVPSDTEFLARRHEAENAARDRSDAEDVPLVAVYRELGDRLGWTEEQMRTGVDAEVAAELSVLRASPRATTLIDWNAQPFAYLSDSVLPETMLAAAIAENGLPTGRVWSSGDRGVRKLTGGLFELVAREFRIDVSEITHVGNDIGVDGLGAARAGARFRLVTDAMLTRYERALDSAETRSQGLLGPVLAGAARRYRLADHANQASGLTDVVAGVAGPTLFCACAWALLSAEAAGNQRLYFAARDGELPVRIARVLQERLGLASTIECRYLYGSRRSWRDAADEVNSAEPTEKLDNLTAYLMQEGLLDRDASVGIMDVGWLGRAASSLDAVIAHGGGDPVRWYFLGGLLHGGGQHPAPSDYRAYLIPQEHESVVDRRDLVHLLEAFCGGCEGTTVGFQARGDRVEPVLKHQIDQALIDWGLPAFQTAVLEFVGLACEGLEVVDERPTLSQVENMRQTLRHNVSTLWSHPTRDEAITWSAYPFENPTSTAATRLAQLPALSRLVASLQRPTELRRQLSIGPWSAAAFQLLTARGHMPELPICDASGFEPGSRKRGSG